MTTNERAVRMDTKTKISTLWIVVMFNMAFADILSFMMQSVTNEAPEVQVTQVFMLAMAVILEIPIAMIFLSRVLKYTANRWANIVASVITIAFVVVGGSAYLHYIFFAAIEVMCMLLIIWFAWKWPNPES